MFKWLKNKKEETLKKLQEECNAFNEKYSTYFNKFCLDEKGQLFFIKGFRIKDNECYIVLDYGEEEMTRLRPIAYANLIHGSFDNYYLSSRKRWNNFKLTLDSFGYKIIEND